MGIEKNKDGAYLPDKQTNWTDLSQEERSEVYGSLKEKYGGSMARLDLKKELEEKGIKEDVEKDLGKTVEDFWNTVKSYDFEGKFNANDPKLKGMPVSMALKLCFEKGLNSKKGIYDGFEGKQEELMFYSLDYLQNAPENAEANKKWNIDKVPMDGSVEVHWNESQWRWEVIIKDRNEKTLYRAYPFPSDKDVGLE